MKKIWTTYQGYNVKKRFENTAIQPWEPSSVSPGDGYFEAIRERPARPLSIESDFLTPLLQSVAVAFFCFLATIYIILYFSKLIWHLSCFISIIVGGLFFLSTIALNRKLLWIAETIVQEDGDGQIGTRSLPPIEVMVRDENKKSIRRIYNLDTDIDDERILAFVEAILGGTSLSESNWTGSANLFSKSEYGRLASELERAGLIQWKGAKNQGRELTQAGVEAFRRLTE